MEKLYWQDSIFILKWHPGGWISIKMSPYQYRKFHCGDKTILRLFYLHNGIFYTDKITSLYWIRALGCKWSVDSSQMVSNTRLLNLACWCPEQAIEQLVELPMSRGFNIDVTSLTSDKQRVLMHRHQGWNVRHGLCHIYMRYIYIYELFIAFVCFVVCSLL